MGHLLGKTKTMKNLRQIETITKTIAMANKASRLTMKVAKESINRLIRTISKLCRRAAGRKITLCLAEATKISRMNLAWERRRKFSFRNLCLPPHSESDAISILSFKLILFFCLIFLYNGYMYIYIYVHIFIFHI